MRLNNIIVSYTWKDEYCLPYESRWSRIAKFCYLNGLSWSTVRHNITLRHSITCGDLPKHFYIHMPHFNGQYKHLYASNFTNIGRIEAHKMCIKCMKYGYHSLLHEIKGIDYCFLHNCKLTEIPEEKLNASQSGTYEFAEVKTEYLIKNQKIKEELTQYIQRRASNEIISSSYIFLMPIKNIHYNRCYDSTNRLYQKIFLLQDRISLQGCECIRTINKENIENDNTLLVDNFMKCYAKYVIEEGWWKNNLLEGSFDNAVNYHKELFIKKDCENQNILKGDSLGWCLMEIMSELIRDFYTDLNDWKATISCLNKLRHDTVINKKNVHKYAIAFAYQAVTGAASADNIFTTNSKHWKKTSSQVSFGLSTYNELGYFHELTEFYKYSPTRASQYIVYPIMKDLLYNLINQAEYMMLNNIIKLEYKFINTLTPEIWKVPQYVVFYYKNRVEIYRCEQEIHL
ncbi:MAG: hypothetical protein IKK33_13405 [Lachnospiraceae bacterium]|nr:hypothetical protein [Lachnospiraceae bacterium]